MKKPTSSTTPAELRSYLIEMGIVTPNFAPVKEVKCKSCSESFEALAGRFVDTCGICESSKRFRR